MVLFYFYLDYCFLGIVEKEVIFFNFKIISLNKGKDKEVEDGIIVYDDCGVKLMIVF